MLRTLLNISGQVSEVQFTGSRGLMRFCQVILGFERNKQAEGQAKNVSKIRLLKDRKYGQTGYIHTEYMPETGKMNEFIPDEEYEAAEAASDAEAAKDAERPF